MLFWSGRTRQDSFRQSRTRKFTHFWTQALLICYLVHSEKMNHWRWRTTRSMETLPSFFWLELKVESWNLLQKWSSLECSPLSRELLHLGGLCGGCCPESSRSAITSFCGHQQCAFEGHAQEMTTSRISQERTCPIVRLLTLGMEGAGLACT